MREKAFINKVSEAGGTAYVVGGWNRDVIMGKEPKDKDYCVVGLNKEKFMQIFPESKQVIGKDGKQTVDVFLLEIDGEVQEVALARKEKKKGTGYHGFDFISDEYVTIEDDLSRRDLTINSIAFDLEKEIYVDPFNGIEDIQKGVLRATSEAFYEDPLRVYRVAVRHAKTGFKVEERTKEMMKQAAKELPDIPKERVVQELRNAFNSERPDLFFRLLQELGILWYHFPQVAQLRWVTQPIKSHPEGDVFEHTMRVLLAMRKLTDDEALLFSSLVHDLGKGITPKELLPKHHGHEEAGVPLVMELCKQLGIPKKWKKAAVFATKNHGRFHNLHKMRDVKVVDLLTEAERNPLKGKGLALIGLADTRGKANPEANYSNVDFALRIIDEFQQVKGNKELEGRKAWDDKRKRQAVIVKEIKKTMAAIL